ncbi:MAG TPA: O-antigen ligase family protein [Pseudonocardiaceae bacterium]|nr:O-antigen ligase family protein [Pseudonocardiaceae bacterium]
MLLAAAIRLEWLAVGVVLFGAACVLTCWRPRYGLTCVIVAAVVLEPIPQDPITHIGWQLQSDLASWTPLSFVHLFPLELLLLVTLGAVVVQRLVAHQPWTRADLRRPMLLLLGLVVVSLAWGMSRGGWSSAALWQTRGFFALGAVALLAPQVYRTRAEIETVVNLIVVGTVLSSVEILWRRYTQVDAWRGVPIDLAFAHDTPVFMNFVVVLLLARLIWPSSGRQRLGALAIPLILWAEMATQRRAGWVGLDLALLLLAAFMFRMRRKHFFLLVLPLTLLYCGYLGVFWNSEGILAQPARAVRSISNPNARDQSSNYYRYTETADIRLNIRANPVTGIGFGKSFIFYIPLADLSSWVFWHYIAHNSLLWLWMYTGPIGFIAFLSLIGNGIVRGVQILKRSTRSHSAPYLVALTSALLMIASYSYVDVSLTSIRIAAIFGLTLGAIGVWPHLSVSDEGGC